MSAAKPWGESHRREALRRLRELAAIMATSSDGCERSAGHGLARASCEHHCTTEAKFREMLYDRGYVTAGGVDREVRRVRALAEGRLVRETFVAVKVDGVAYKRGDLADARASAAEWNSDPAHAGIRLAYPVRVTRIRRAAR